MDQCSSPHEPHRGDAQCRIHLPPTHLSQNTPFDERGRRSTEIPCACASGWLRSIFDDIGEDCALLSSRLLLWLVFLGTQHSAEVLAILCGAEWVSGRAFSASSLTHCSVWLVMPFITCIVLGIFISNALLRDVSNQVAYAEWNVAPATSNVTTSKTETVPVPVTESVGQSPRGKTRASKASSSGTFTLLEAGANVLIVSPDPLVKAHDEIQHRVKENGVKYFQIDFVNIAQWTMFIKEKKAALVCVTDTLIGSAERKEASVETISDACRSLGTPINVSDHPGLSTFSYPATHRFEGESGPSNLQISISTNGKGCRLGGRLKREIISKLPSNVGAAVDNVGKLRILAKEKSFKGKQISRDISEDDPHTPLNEPVEQLGTPSLLTQVTKELGKGYFPPTDREDQSQLRRMRWVHQMSEYYSIEALARMTETEMENALDTWQGIPTPSQPVLPHHDGHPIQQLGKASSRSRKGRILLIGSGPGHPGLLTVAAHRALQSATLILSDKLVPAEVLSLIPSSTNLHIAKKFPGNNEGAQNELMIQALAAAQQGETVVRLKQGDPFVYGRGGEEVLYFREHGYEAIVIPGVTSAIAGPEMVGIPITQRGVAESMVLCTGVGRAGKSISLPGYVKPRSLVILMGVARIGSIVQTLVDRDSTGRDGAAYPDYLPIAVIERASSPDQRVIVSTLKAIEAGLQSMEERPPGMMVVGWAVLALEGKGRVDVLDRPGEEEIISNEWMGEDRWRVVDGLSEGFAEYLDEVGLA
ncbi:tetrapyrrole methylase [Kockovaella imperatae]|uniref:precorrin-2 dehydrogenase n=1 Tax=Kockovaella imperatae TaxID=4999 RepID=A0A1Y1UKB6_9TREE|nr:tetrapyrrole methylase [Kockovaella imperatae]ORX37565.1 tetrapyrrole methylase [Kockovaella imperatae]